MPFLLNITVLFLITLVAILYSYDIEVVLTHI
jgi:hypothetical protein